ncbi:M23 family metallopeptidase [Paenibacillus mesophilus]|uniref:M23 family metallopeptidase n=1 Tax=Paenibacillus mesophilus TaxID=2582849 RepID=UPI00110F2EF6|nr:M23 family metallopeptidase [Paenibacillus mesophilus]TMV49689.1 M23 family metallopeptidase [Paenibacillus mesophilus]
MRFKWLKKRFTFMVIPDANSHVVRFRLTGWMLSLMTLFIALLAALAVTFYIIQSRSSGTNLLLTHKLVGVTEQFEQTVSEKNTTIEQLQNDLVRLSQQADQVKNKIEELKKLEIEMKTLTGISGGDKPVSILSASPAGSASANMGGDYNPVTDNAIRGLIDDTEQQFDMLGKEIDGLFGTLTETKKQVEEMQHMLAITPNIWPVDSRAVSSGFGVRIDPFNYSPSFHNGMDIAGRNNDPVFVTADGTVITAGWDKSEGNHLVVDHGNGLRTQYMHLNEFLVKKGDKVKKGQQIAKMGSTGRSTGPHLHYGVIKNGVVIDPRPYLKASRKEEP